MQILKLQTKRLHNLVLHYTKRYIAGEQERSSEPTLNDFYTPSKEMKEYQALTMAVTGLGAGLLGHRIYKWYTK